MSHSTPPEGFRCCKPSVNPSFERPQTANRQDGAIHFIAAAPGTPASSISNDCVEKLLSNIGKQSLKAAGRRISLVYQDHALFEELALPDYSHSAVSLPFPGGFVDPSKFFVWERVKGLSSPAPEYLVFIQQPFLSTFEHAINARVGEGLNEINRDTVRKCDQSGMKAPFILVEDSWAIGGFLAVRRILDWKRTRLQTGGSVQ